MFQGYRQLLGKIDRFAAGLRAKYPDSFACRPGCASCCVAGITIWRVEYDHIFASQAGQARQASQASQASKAGQGCGFLDEQGRCTIYDVRPVVCRLWGLPVAREGMSGLCCCEKNFTRGTPFSELSRCDALNQDTVLTTLAAINHVYCRSEGFDPLERLLLSP